MILLGAEQIKLLESWGIAEIDFDIQYPGPLRPSLKRLDEICNAAERDVHKPVEQIAERVKPFFSELQRLEKEGFQILPCMSICFYIEKHRSPPQNAHIVITPYIKAPHPNADTQSLADQGIELYHIRIERDLSIAEVAKKLNLSPELIEMIEQCKIKKDAHAHIAIEALHTYYKDIPRNPNVTVSFNSVQHVMNRLLQMTDIVQELSGYAPETLVKKLEDDIYYVQKKLMEK